MRKILVYLQCENGFKHIPAVGDDIHNAVYAGMRQIRIRLVGATTRVGVQEECVQC